MSNICVAENWKIVILDWQTARKLGEHITWGTRYFDLMWLVYNLFYRPVGRERYKTNLPAEHMAQQFLSAYFRTSDYCYNHEQFVQYMTNFVHNKLTDREKGFKRRLLLIPSHIKLRRFINSLHL